MRASGQKLVKFCTLTHTHTHTHTHTTAAKLVVRIYINELRNVSDIGEFSVFVKYTNIFRFAYIQNVLNNVAN